MAGPRQANLIDLQVQPGIYMQRSSRLAAARYTDGNNVRWYQNLPQKMGGFVEEKLIDGNSGNRVFLQGHARSTKQWDSLDGQNWIAVGTEYKLYLINNHVLYDITPIRRTASLTNAFTTTTGSQVVTVVDANHDAQAGDFVTFSGATAIGNVNVNAEWQIASVIDLNTYTFLYGVPASSNATGGGPMVANYDISSGLTSDGALYGYGVGGYGLEGYGTGRSASTYGGYARIWSLDNFGEDLLAAPNGEALYWWARNTGPNSRAIVRPTAPANIEHMLVGPDDRHVLALGTNLLSADLQTVGGQQDRMFMRWCQGDNFDLWVQSTANDAGSKRLDTGSRIITGCKTRTSIVIFTDEGMYSVSLVGGQDVYQVLPIANSAKIISPGAAVDVNGVVWFMGEKSFYYYDGTVHDLPCDISDYVFGTEDDPTSGLNRQMASKVTCRVRLSFFEIHWSFTSTSADENDSTAIYNWQTQCWTKSSIERECGLDKNVFYGVPIGFNDTGMYLEETGNDVGTEEPLFNFLLTWEGEFSMTARRDVPQNQTLWANASGSMLMLIHSLIPDFKSQRGSLTIQCRGREFTNDALVYGDVLTITGGVTTQVDPQFCQRRVALYQENYNMGDFWRMDFWRALASPLGRR